MERLFNREAEFTAKIFSGEEKVATLRFPTDQELCDRARKMKVIRKNLGRGKTQTDPGNALELQAALFDKLRLDKDGPTYDAADAASFVNKLDRCEITEVEREGNQFRVTMKVPNATVVHVLKMPTQQDVMDFGRNSLSAIDERRQTEIRLRLEPSGELWKKLFVAVEGYKGNGNGIPITHQDAAVSEVISQMQKLEEEDDPED